MGKKLSYNNDLLRIKNRGQIFEQLVTHDGIYRMDLVEACGLTKMTISNIVSEFLEKGILVETTKNEENRPGRKSTMLCLSPKAKKIVGLMIDRDYISVALCDCQLNVIRSDSIHLSDINLDSLLKKIFQLVDDIKQGYEILGIGVGSIGPIDSRKGMILNPPNFHGIKNVPIVQILEERYGIPVYLDYHFNCAARVEKYFGFGRNYKNFILLGISPGLGISIVADGKIHTRTTGVSSEFGHMTVDYNGPVCFCGRRGCLGSYMDFKTEEGTWNSVKMITTVLTGVCDILVPQAVIIKDECSWMEKEHIDWMNQEVNKKIIAHDYQKIKVCKAQRSQQIEASDCAANILGRIFGGEIEI